jgi:hypothetical protein
MGVKRIDNVSVYGCIRILLEVPIEIENQSRKVYGSSVYICYIDKFLLIYVFLKK